LLTCTHTAWKSTSAPLLFCTSGEERVENLRILRGQLAPCQEKRIKRQQTVSSARCKVLAPNAVFLLASISSYCRFRAIECCYSQPSGNVHVSFLGHARQPAGFLTPRLFLARSRRIFPPGLDSLQRQLTSVVSSRISQNEGAENARRQTDKETGQNVQRLMTSTPRRAVIYT